MKKKLTLFLCALCAAVLLGGCETTPRTAAAPPSGASLSVHFIDVGQADAALLVCGEHSMLIDGGNVADSSLLVSYLTQQGIQQLDYVVCTHAHEDHVGGLAGALNACTAAHVLSPVKTYDSKAYRDFQKYTEKQGRAIELPAPDDTFMLGAAEVTVLGPRKDYGDDTNNTSIVLRVVFGETSFLFTGDMERKAEADLLAAGVDLSATVLKVGHHGSPTSTSYPFLREVMPQYAVVSVGTDNSYGHPSADTLSRLRDAETTVYRTDLQGTVVATSDGKEVTFTTDTATPPAVGRTDQAAATYIGNANSKVYHTEKCSALPSAKNRVTFTDRAAAEAAGYTPCGRCMS